MEAGLKPSIRSFWWRRENPYVLKSTSGNMIAGATLHMLRASMICPQLIPLHVGVRNLECNSPSELH
jgi:hypothetical protein